MIGKWSRSLKRLTMVVLAMLMAVMFVACGNKTGGGGSSNNDDNADGTVKAPVITAFAIEADTGAAYGKVNETHKLSYTVTGDKTGETITVKKGNDEAAETDYEYNEQTKKIVFKTLGNYAVTLKVSNGDKSMSKSDTITISEIAAPVINNMPADANVRMNTAVDFAPVVSYDDADKKDEEVITVKYNGADATAEDYTLAEGKFTPKRAGEYKVTVSVTSAKGKTAQKTWTLNSKGMGEITLGKVTDGLKEKDGKYLVKKGAATELAYTAGDDYDANDFTITYSLKKDDADVENVTHDVAEKKLTVTISELGTYVLTLTFTNKNDTSKVSSETWNLLVQNDINTPTFGADPFGGTHTTLKPGVGMLLYFDASDVEIALAHGDNVNYEIVTAETTAAGARIVNTGAYKKYPYLIATGAGDIKVKLTVTDGENQIEDTKVFTVVTTYDSYDAYFKTVYTNEPGNKFSDANSGIWAFGADMGKTTMIATKNGFITAHERSNQDEAHPTLAGIFIGDRTAFTLEFDLTVIRTVDGNFSTMYFKFWNDATNANAGAFGLGVNWKKGENFGAFSNTAPVINSSTPGSVAQPAEGKPARIRLVRNGGDWKIEVSVNGGAYANLLTGNGDAAAVVNRIFICQMDYGDFMLENFTVA